MRYDEQKAKELRELCDRIGTKDSNQYSGGTLYRALYRGGIWSVEQLKNTPIEDLLKIRHLGEKKVTYIMSKLLEESERARA